jgi:hypothetical protein
LHLSTTFDQLDDLISNPVTTCAHLFLPLIELLHDRNLSIYVGLRSRTVDVEHVDVVGVKSSSGRVDASS